MNLAGRIWNHLAKSQIIVSAGATALFAVTALELTARVSLLQVGFIFSTTWIMYMSHRCIGLWKNPRVSKTERFSYILENRVWIALIYLPMIFLAVYAGLMILPQQNWVHLLAPLLLVVMYSVPVFAGKRLRDISYVKLPVIGVVWAMVTVQWVDSYQTYPFPFAGKSTFHYGYHHTIRYTGS